MIASAEGGGRGAGKVAFCAREPDGWAGDVPPDFLTRAAAGDLRGVNQPRETARSGFVRGAEPKRGEKKPAERP